MTYFFGQSEVCTLLEGNMFFCTKRNGMILTGDVRFDIPIIAINCLSSQFFPTMKTSTGNNCWSTPRKLTEAVGAIHKTGGLGAFYVGYGTMALCPENGTATGGTGEWT